jgi:membrane associated rhomboid family serine protease
VNGRDGIKVRAAALGSTVGVMWIVRVLDSLLPGMGSAAGHGIVPRTWIGIEGIPIAPLIHGSWGHLLANTIPLIILGGLVLLRGVSEFVFVVLTSALIGGAGTWLFGASNTHHIGASGVVFGLFGYLLFRTAFDWRLSSALITVIVGLLYGSAMISGLIPATGISWSGHIFGFVGGVIAARVRYPNRARRMTW